MSRFRSHTLSKARNNVDRDRTLDAAPVHFRQQVFEAGKSLHVRAVLASAKAKTRPLLLVMCHRPSGRITV